MKTYQVLSSLSLRDAGIYLRDGPFESDVGISILRPSIGTHWVVYINFFYFDCYGCAPLKNIPKYMKHRHRKCGFSEYQIQQNDSLCASYVFYFIYFVKVLRIDFKTAVLNLYYQTFSLYD